MSHPEPDLESGVRKKVPSEKESVTVTASEQGNSYFQAAIRTDPALDPPYLEDLRSAIASLELAHTQEAAAAKYNRKKQPKPGLFSWIKRRSPPVKYAIYLAPLIVLLVIPIAVLGTVFYNRASIATGLPSNPNQSIRAAGLFVWLEIAAVALWVSMSLAWLSIKFFNWTCDVFKHKLKTRQLLFDALKDISNNLMALPVTLVLWTIICFASTSAICVFDKDNGQCIQSPGWIWAVNRAFEAGIVVSFILLVERLIIGMSFISYYGKQYDSKNGVLQADINHVRNLFYLTLHRPANHKHKLHKGQASTCQDCKQTGKIDCLSSWENDWNDVFNDAIRHEDTAGNLATYLWYAMKLDQIDLTMATDEQAEEMLKKDILTDQFRTWLCRDRQNFSDEMERRLFGENSLDLDDDSIVKEYTDILNGDNDNDITHGEMLTAVKRLGRRREMLEKTMYSVREAMESLDRPLSVVVLIAVAFVYGMQLSLLQCYFCSDSYQAAFFVPNFNVYATAIFTAFTGLGFALSGTVTDFLGSCIFLFVKHPYYVGDRIEINRVQLYVHRIALMTTRFNRVDNGKFVQLPHSLLNTYWIENLSRSKRLKEYFTISISPDTDFQKIEDIEADLKTFVKRNDRDFKVDSVGISLSSMSDLTQLQLDIEVEHKVSILFQSPLQWFSEPFLYPPVMLLKR